MLLDSSLLTMRSPGGASPRRSVLPKRAALILHTAIGVVLAGLLLSGLYQDWTLGRMPRWSALAQHGLPLLCALSIPVLGKRWARRERGAIYASETALWSLLGGVGTALACAVVFGGPLARGEIQSEALLPPLSAVGAFAGLLVGYGFTRARALRTDKERSLREHQACLDALFEGSPDMIALHDAAGTLLDANPRLREKTGYTGAELADMTVWDLDQDMDPDHAQHFWKGMVVGENHRVEGTYRRKDGSTFPVEAHVRRLDLDGTDRFVALVRDITEQNEREARLRERRQKVEALYEATNRLLRADDEETVVDLLVSLVDETLGYPATTIRLTRDDQLHPVRVPSMVRSHMPERPSYALEGDTPAAKAYRSGQTHVYDDLAATEQSLERGDIRATAYVPMGQYGLISVGSLEVGGISAFDLRLMEVLATYASVVLGRLAREEELREAKEEAERSSRAMSTFLANMSHEIRTPLTSIIGFAEVLGTEARSLDAARPLENYAGMIERSGKRLLETLDGVLNLSRLQSTEMTLDTTPVCLGKEANRAAEELRPQAEENDVDLTVETRPAPATANEGGVQIVARNLVSNAIKYTEAGGRVTVRTYPEDDECVALEVADTGIGMESSTVEAIFEPFRQASEGLGREYEGTGIGLAVTREATRQMDGTIEVETEKGEGSCFTVRLPRASNGEQA